MRSLLFGRGTKTAWPWIVLGGWGSEVGYLVFAVLTQVNASLHGRQIGKITGWVLSALFFAIVLALFAIYRLTLQKSMKEPKFSAAGHRWIMVFTVLFCLTLLAAYPLSPDVFYYALYGKIVSVYHENPFITTGNHYSQDALYTWAGNPVELVPYGPLWVLSAAALTKITHTLRPNDVILNLVVFKLFAAVFHIINVLLIGRFLTHSRPGWATVGILLYAWNPLILVEVAGGAHNDVFMVTFILLALNSHLTDKSYLTVPFLILAALIKWVGIILVPMYLLFQVRQGNKQQWTALLLGCLVAGGLFLLMWWPFWAGRPTLIGIIEQQWDSFGLSVLYVCARLLKYIAKTLGGFLLELGEAVRIVKYVITAFFMILYARLALRAKNTEQIIRGYFIVLLTFSSLVISLFFDWYLIWPLALLAVQPWSQLRETLIFLSFATFTAYNFLLPIIGWSDLYYLMAPILAFGLTLLFALWQARRSLALASG